MQIGISVDFTLPATDNRALLSIPMRRFLMQGMTLTHGYIASPGVVPIDTGRLRTSLQPGSGLTGVDPQDPPEWFKVGTNVKYAAPLDSPEERDPHYRAGPSKGNPTKGWLSDSPAHVRPQIEALLPALAADIRKAWGG